VLPGGETRPPLALEARPRLGGARLRVELRLGRCEGVGNPKARALGALSATVVKARRHRSEASAEATAAMGLGLGLWLWLRLRRCRGVGPHPERRLVVCRRGDGATSGWRHHTAHELHVLGEIPQVHCASVRLLLRYSTSICQKGKVMHASRHLDGSESRVHHTGTTQPIRL
jgi:hypothetical protein